MPIEQIFTRGEKALQNFTGSAFVNMLVPDADDTYHCQVYDVLFEPGCRNDWHSHAGGQLLLCTGGTGYYQQKGKAARRLQKGDVVSIPPGAVHWHGAAPDAAFTHIGISPNTQSGGATWFSPVTEDEYKQATGGV